MKPGAVTDNHESKKDESEEVEEDDDDEDNEDEEDIDNKENTTTENKQPSPDTPTSSTSSTPSAPSTPTSQQDTTKPETQPATTEDKGQEEEKQEDDDDGWITPDNISSVRAKRGKEDELEDVEVDVGCFTTDYAMQVIIPSPLYFLPPSLSLPLPN
jgi:rRNA maturation endonuclease Nob1